MTKPFLVEQEVRHYAVVLRQLIRAAGLSVSEVERRIGRGEKSLRRVFGGQVDLKFRHVLAVLHVLGIPPERFFAIAVAARRRNQPMPAAELVAGIGDTSGLGGAAATGPEGPLPPQSFERLVETAVQRVVERLQTQQHLQHQEPRSSPASAAGAARPSTAEGPAAESQRASSDD